jgi:hypothetical protein
MARVTVSGVQTVVGITAGLISVTGGVYSGIQYLARPARGEVVAVVEDARSQRPLPDASIEILAPGDALVATLAPAAGTARQSLAAGSYRLRVTHPRFAPETRLVDVAAGRTSYVRVRLVPRAREGPRLGQAPRVVRDGFGAIERVLRGLGL